MNELPDQTPRPMVRIRTFATIVAFSAFLFGIVNTDYLMDKWYEWSPKSYPRRFLDLAKPYKPMWGSSMVFPLPTEGAPWKFEGIELGQGVVFDESERFSPPAGFKHGVWADVTVEENGPSCLVRFAPARRWEGTLQFTSATESTYSLPVQVHAPFNDRGRERSFLLRMWPIWCYWLWIVLAMSQATRRSGNNKALPTSSDKA
jgi:hypothetical protein